MNVHENQRTRLTKQLIKDSLLSLLENNEINKISIKSICENAQINRSTFYKHYGSQYDVLSELEDALISESEQILGNDRMKTDIEVCLSYETFCVYIEKNKKVYQLLTNNIGSNFPQKLIGHQQMKVLLQNQLPDCYSEDDMSYIYTFVAYGIYQLLVEWLHTDCMRPAQEIAELIHKLLDNICLKQ